MYFATLVTLTIIVKIEKKKNFGMIIQAKWKMEYKSVGQGNTAAEEVLEGRMASK